MSAAVVARRPILLVCLAVFGLMTGPAVFTFVHPGVRRTPAAAPVPMEGHGAR